jgi:hypothetical protein
MMTFRLAETHTLLRDPKIASPTEFAAASGGVAGNSRDGHDVLAADFGERANPARGIAGGGAAADEIANIVEIRVLEPMAGHTGSQHRDAGTPGTRCLQGIRELTYPLAGEIVLRCHVSCRHQQILSNFS